MFLAWRQTYKSEQQDQQAAFAQLLISAAMYIIIKVLSECLDIHHDHPPC